MPSCCIRFCKSSVKKGFRLFRIPREKKRGDIWRRFTGRNDLTYYSVICEAHFDDKQFEQNRLDGRKLLRNNAIPTLLPPNDYLKDYDQNYKKYCAIPQCSDEIKDADIDCKNDLPEIANIKTEMLQIPQCSNEVRDTEMDCDSDLIEIENLQKQVKMLLQEKMRWNFKLERLCKIFNDDQLQYLEYGTHNGFCWSDETINRAAQLYSSCGTTGYQELRNLNLPYPGARTLQKRMQSLKFQPAI